MTFQWVLSAEKAKKLILEDATILDVRNKIAYLLGHIAGAVHVTWQQFSQPKLPDKGKLIDDINVLEKQLGALGIFNHKPVVVVGNPAHNFGEEGRIVWMLRTLGHSQAAFVDGGYSALVKAGVPTTWGFSHNQEIGDFIVQRTGLWEIHRDEIKASLSQQNFLIIDTRELGEYTGSTPYGEKRGGHIPGAVHFYFKDLLDKDGNLLPRDQIMDRLENLRIESSHPIAAYCTGGIRSAFFVAVLADLGFTNVKNYAGSMWEWSATSASNYPLEK
ncbi:MULTISPECIES: sulfurtransferase [Cyanophyceae]|uniref:sulfurtransferase n=1 Tax=Cyanophyceae TaxID=3028117 RepID=UPI0016854BEA|nr:rhodanese-like domain-containing protein [Trichocoleus sp. FACHB-69]MBD1930539.1 sulfurtransferase [Trichocoleus sp. FACHB-69]